MLKTLMELCALDGVSGNESAGREYIAGRISPFVQQMETDPMGNLIAFKKGKRCPDVKLMLAAHMDEVGIIVTSISDEGYLKFSFVGGVDRRVAIGKRVNIGGISGVIGLKAYHLVSASEEKKVPKTTEMYIDIGADSKEEAEKLVRIGDTGVFESDYVNFGEGMVKCLSLIHILELIWCMILNFQNSDSVTYSMLEQFADGNFDSQNRLNSKKSQAGRFAGLK